MFELEGVDLEFTDEALREISRKALSVVPVPVVCVPFANPLFKRPCLICRLTWILRGLW